MKSYQITNWCHQGLKSHLAPDGLYIDATMGNGHDTLFLCRLAGETGKVYAFDIQSEALKNTENLLIQNEMKERATLILDSHARMEHYFEPNSIDGICFNFGYLPGGDHQKATRPDTSVSAVRQGLNLLKKDGVMSLCIYSGKDTGFAEKETLLEYIKGLDSREYVVIVSTYYNRSNNPPIPVLIFKT